MSRLRDDFRRYAGEVKSKLRKQPPIPMYQKVVVGIMVLGTLVGLLAVLFSR